MVKKAIIKKGSKEIAKKVKPKPKPKTRPKKTAPPAATTPKTATTPKSKIPAAVPPIAAGTAVIGAGIAGANKNKGGKTFDDAFRTARAKGEGTKFTFNGKSYVAVTKDDLKKKGYKTDTSGLAAYNRAGGRKKIDIDAAAKKIVGEVNKNNKAKTRKQKRQERRKERIGFATFKERRQARRAARKMKSGGVVSARGSKPRGVGAAKRGFGRALKG
tara:strand:- start:767 stop:1414 length:648 start_codon:yes stop_codon:yes gene_type:complete